jgi:cell division protein ZapA (FtsZ GTPase activity inhibitor)
MSLNPSSIEVEFFGQKISLKSEGEFEVVQEAVELAKVRVTEASRRGKSAAPHQIALLALLDLCEEYVRARRRTIDYRRELSARAEALQSTLEQV